MSNKPIEQAFQAFNQGRLEEVRTLCSALVDAPGGRAPALMLLGLIAEKQRNFHEAISLLEQSVCLEPHLWSLVTLASCLWRVGRLHDGLTYAEQALTKDPNFPQAQLVAANLLHGLRRFDDALARIVHAQQLTPNSHLVVARLGCTLLRLGRFDEAVAHFQKTEQLNPAFAHCRLVKFDHDFWRVIAPKSDDQTYPLQVPDIARMEQPYDAVVSAFCDAKYFRKYGTPFMNSFSQNASRNKLLHLHILDPDDGLHAHISALIAKVNLCNIAVTLERAPLDQTVHEKLRKAFYTCSRFLHMNALLHRYNTTIACFDIDTIFESPLDELVTITPGQDLALHFREPPDSPWLDVIANVFVALNTEAAKRYLAGVSNFIRYFASRGELFWHVDQIALYCVLTMMERFSKAPTVRCLGPADLSSVWHIGHSYDFRLQNERFTRYRIRPFGE